MRGTGLDYSFNQFGDLVITADLEALKEPELTVTHVDGSTTTFPEDSGISNDMGDVLSFMIENGWDYVTPEEIGALTSNPWIITQDAVRDGAGDLVDVRTVYFYGPYEVYNPAERLAARGSVIFERSTVERTDGLTHEEAIARYEETRPDR